MLAWLKKFVLDIMPSIAATIIGAYIVNHYIIPKAPNAPQTATASASVDSKASDSKASDSKTGDSKPLGLKADDSAEKTGFEKTGFEKAVADKAAIDKTAEKAAADKATADRPDNVAKHHPVAKVASKPVAEERRAVDDRRANELARAAIDRLRNTPEAAKAEQTKDSTKTESAKVEANKSSPAAASVVSASPVTTASIGPAPVAAPPMQPLPPAINVTTPNASVFEQGNAQPVLRQPSPQTASRQDDARVSPPGEIPGRRPLDLRAEALSSPPSERTNVADEVVSAAKSMFHAVIPR
jgi:hypothetical protein